MHLNAHLERILSFLCLILLHQFTEILDCIVGRQNLYLSARGKYPSVKVAAQLYRRRDLKMHHIVELRLYVFAEAPSPLHREFQAV